MKMNITVEIDQNSDINSIQEEIIDRASENVIEQVLGDYYDDTSLYTKLEKRVIGKLETIMDLDFKNEVAKKVTENLANKFEKTMQYKVLKADGEVITDALIKTGLRDLVADIVKSEMKKVFQ
jgi:hypothetical protein